MKKRNLMYVLFILSLGFGLFSCIFDGKNTVTRSSPAVVGNNMSVGGTTVGTWYGAFAAPGLDPSYEGECVMLDFTIDWNKQPSADFVTASDIKISSTVPQKPLELTDSVRIDDYTLRVSSARVSQLQTANGLIQLGTSPYYDGKVFLEITCQDSNPDFRLVYNVQEPDSAGIKNLYLLAMPSSSSATNVSKEYNYAFDVASLIQYAGIVDTIGTIAGYNGKYIKANLKYFTGMSDDGVPSYGTVNTYSTSPYFFAVFPDDY